MPVFSQVKNIVVTGGQFISTPSPTDGSGFTLLQKLATPSALHNSAQRVDPPRCHENTRQAVLKEIFAWIVQDVVERTAWVVWLNGAAGAGKSAIAQSMAELCITHGILVASFFFNRSDPNRNNINRLVATLSYQLTVLLPKIKDTIVEVIESDPLIFEQSFDTQLEKLITTPLRTLRLTYPTLELVFIIDGIDECLGINNQRSLVHTFAKFLTERDCPIIVLFASRAESHLVSAFRYPVITPALLNLSLDNQSYLPDKDIRLYLDDKFAEIKDTHFLRHLLANNWPAENVLQEIVSKSSGQFIYASTAMNFVSLPRTHPVHQLEIVRGLRPVGSQTPFANLDALYRHIFSQVEDLETTKKILAYCILGRENVLYYVSNFFNMSGAEIEVVLSSLASLVVIDNSKTRIHFLHASLADFLCDRLRSQEYYIDPVTWGTYLSIIWFKNVASGNGDRVADYSIVWYLHEALVECPPALRPYILQFDPYQAPRMMGFLADNYLHALRKLKFWDGGAAYRHQLEVVIRFLRKEKKHEMLSYVAQYHDISEIQAAIDLEETKSMSRKVGEGERSQPWKLWLFASSAMRIILPKRQKETNNTALSTTKADPRHMATSSEREALRYQQRKAVTKKNSLVDLLLKPPKQRLEKEDIRYLQSRIAAESQLSINEAMDYQSHSSPLQRGTGENDTLLTLRLPLLRVEDADLVPLRHSDVP